MKLRIIKSHHTNKDLEAALLTASIILNSTNKLKIIPKKWSPGLHSPVDPVASKLAQKKDLKISLAYGRDLKNLENILEDKKFKGTVLSN